MTGVEAFVGTRALWSFGCMVPEAGLEPARFSGRGILNSPQLQRNSA